MFKRLFVLRKTAASEQIDLLDGGESELVAAQSDDTDAMQEEEETPRRNKQKNIKTTTDVILAFRRCALARGLSESVLFEDMVAEVYERLKREGKISA